MTPTVSDIIEQARLAARAFAEFGGHLIHPTVRLGVTGLSRAGKTVFITALLHGLLRGGRFPVFEPLASGRIAGARLAPQPDDAVPRFDYERHVRSLVIEREWPESTRQISELRVVIDYQSAGGAMRTLTLDIVDYPGEWLLDLPLLDKSYEQWSAETLAHLRRTTRPPLPSAFLDRVATIDPFAPADEYRRDRGGAAVHRLSAGPPARAPDAQHDRARPLPDAGRSRRLAGADLRAAGAARRRRAAAGLGLGDDAAALRFLSRRRGAAVLPRSFRPPRPADRAGRCAGRARRRTRGDARSAGRDGRGARLLPRRPRRLAQRAVCAARRPHPVRRHQGRSVAPFRARPAGGDPQAPDRSAPSRAPATPAPRST